MSFSRNLLPTIVLLLLLSSVFSARAQGQSSHAKSASEAVYVTARLLSDTTCVQPGKNLKLGVELTMQPGWHTYYKESGDAGMPTKIDWKLPGGFTAGSLLWVKPEKFNDAGIVTYGYKGTTTISAPITVPKEISGNTVTFSADVKWLSCREICIPGGTKVTLTLPVDKTGAAAKPDHIDQFNQSNFDGSIDQAGTTSPAASSAKDVSVLDQKFDLSGSQGKRESLLIYLSLALVGGIILNVMPCVLPVIAIKVLSFFEQAKDEPGRVRILGLIFSAGIISSFMLLALIVICIQATGQKVGWGFQFQYPGFLIAMSAVVLLFAMSLFGIFYIMVPGQTKIDSLANKEGYVGTFFKGVLATVLSTPCTAPFLGTALGFAFAEPWYTVLLIFFTIGVGMALPYLILTAKPGWMKLMPKPGAWMEKFKESLGFILLATVVWLLSVLGSQLGIEGITKTTYFLLALAFSAWFVGWFVNLSSTNLRRYTSYGVVLSMLAAVYSFTIGTLPGVSTVPRSSPPPAATQLISWQPFSVEALNKQLAEHKTVFIDFTADWCLTCKFNEQTVLATEPVVDKMKALNIVPMKADWTVQDPAITKLLNKFNRSGVPLYVIFPADKPNEPIVLPEVVTQQLVLNKLDEAGASK